MRQTAPLNLKSYKLKDREDIIKYIVQKEDVGTGFVGAVPAFVPLKKQNFSIASAYAFSRNFLYSLRP